MELLYVSVSSVNKEKYVSIRADALVTERTGRESDSSILTMQLITSVYSSMLLRKSMYPNSFFTFHLPLKRIQQRISLLIF